MTKAAATAKYLHEQVTLRTSLLERRRKLLPTQQQTKQLKKQQVGKVAARDKVGKEIEGLRAKLVGLDNELAAIAVQLKELEAASEEPSELVDVPLPFAQAFDRHRQRETRNIALPGNWKIASPDIIASPEIARS